MFAAFNPKVGKTTEMLQSQHTQVGQFYTNT